LEEISAQNGRPFARAHLLFDTEEAHSQEVLKYKGYLALSDAFKCFYLESVEAFNTEIRPQVRDQLSEFFGMLVPRISHSFLTLCGAERIAIRGYPYQGYTLIRNVFDTLVLTSAALQRVVDFYSIEGVVPGQTLDRHQARQLRKRTEIAAREQMTGSQSGLTDQALSEIGVWDSLFDLETHGARLSSTHAVPWMKKEGPLAVLPRFEEMAWALYMNRYIEVSWMLHRIIPTIQPPGVPFSERWRNKWDILDLSFRESVSALTEQMHKPIGAALVELVDKKFPFNSQSRFPL
jgi:hypothetical protein